LKYHTAASTIRNIDEMERERERKKEKERDVSKVMEKKNLICVFCHMA
jgi:hypothetical protein